MCRYGKETLFGTLKHVPICYYVCLGHTEKPTLKYMQINLNMRRHVSLWKGKGCFTRRHTFRYAMYVLDIRKPTFEKYISIYICICIQI